MLAHRHWHFGNKDCGVYPVHELVSSLSWVTRNN